MNLKLKFQGKRLYKIQTLLKNHGKILKIEIKNKTTRENKNKTSKNLRSRSVET